MLILKILDEAQIVALYESSLKRDFPPSELKSLSAILSMMRKGRYDVLGALDGETLVAYALMYCPGDRRVVLLDYLAVEPQMRNQGVGSALLLQLRDYYRASADVLMIECERPKSAPDEAEARKRIHFYTRAGAILTNVRIWLFDVEYSILALPCSEAAPQADWAELMLSMYQQMLPKALYEQNVRLIRG